MASFERQAKIIYMNDRELIILSLSEKTKQKTLKCNSIGEMLKTKGLRFFVSFFSCDLQDFKL